ncbi:regulatory TetR family protein [Mumia flava]|uniref:Regulatory TetR family protein n=1 Tax=Mumia flava TaxID=1348852 RepID=A0A0B2AWS0_9ACTN|nr:TetR family transcriptional regulator [Mumia flava]PJJ48166.1 regulatory TetR family protein [Mumia flava]
MPSRRDEILDAAIDLVGTRGFSRLTHRAVDDAAGLAAGSTSNHFRTKQALVAGVVDRFALRERAWWDELAAGSSPMTPGDLVATLTAFARAGVREHRAVTLTRFALMVEAGLDESIRAEVAATGMRVRQWASQWMRALGASDPVQAARIVGAHLDGLVLHELAHPDPAFDPQPRIAAVVAAVLADPPDRTE